MRYLLCMALVASTATLAADPAENAPRPLTLPEWTTVEVDRAKFCEGWRQTIDFGEQVTIEVWVADGWLYAKRAMAGVVEWQIVLARVRAVELPAISHLGEFEFRLSYGDGRYFVRDMGEFLRCMREPKEDAGYFERTRVMSAEAATRGWGRTKRTGDWFLSSWEDDGWYAVGLGPDEDQYDAFVRLDPIAQASGGYGVFTTIHGFAQGFHGERWIIDDGDLLIAQRMTKAQHDAELARERVRTNLADSGLPAIEATQWINANDEPTWTALRGKVVLVDFWGTWCGPCVKKLPAVQRLAEKYADAGLVVIGVHSAQGGESCEEFVAENGITFPVAIDTGSTAKSYAIEAWPTLFVIDKEGKVVSSYEHDVPNDEQIEALLQQ